MRYSVSIFVGLGILICGGHMAGLTNARGDTNPPPTSGGERLFPVCENGKRGFINAEGEVMLPL
jgi:hypothetical protein